MSSFWHEKPLSVLSPLDEDASYELTLKLRELLAEDDEWATMRAELVSVEGEQVGVRVTVTLPTGFQAGSVVRGTGQVSLTAVSDAEKCEGLLAIVTLHRATKTASFDDLSLRISHLRAFLLSRIRAALPERESGLFCALLLGERDTLPAAFSRDMTRRGTVHILALSGTHVVLLSTALDRLLRRAYFGRHLRNLLICAFFLLFIVLTGFAPSVLRACFMFFFAVAGKLLRVEQDSLTALFAAVGTICLIEPYAATSLSLWLSALATLGILLAFDRMRRTEKPRSIGARVGHFCLTSLAITLSASAATLPLTALYFGTLPLLSPLANFLLMPLFQIALYLAALVALIGPFAPLSALSRIACSPIFFLTEALSAVPDSVIFIGEGVELLLTLTLFGGLALYFCFCSKKSFLWRVPLAFFLCFSLLLSGTLLTKRVALGEDVKLFYSADAEGEADFLLLRAKEADLFFVMSAGAPRSAKVQNEALASVTELDGVVFLSYGELATAALCALLEERTVRALYLPAPANTQEELSLRTVKEAAHLCGTAIHTFAPEEALPLCEGISFFLLERHAAVTGETQGAVFRLTVGDTRLLYTSGGSMKPSLREELALAEVLCAGAFGGEPFLRYYTEDFPHGARVLCADAAYFPFFEWEGVAFSAEQSLMLKRNATP